MTDDLEALFDEIAAQNDSSTAEKTSTVASDPTEEDLEALFDEIAEQNVASTTVKTDDASESSETESTEEDLEALFNEISAQNTPKTSSVEAVPEVEPTEEDLEALFNGIVAQNASSPDTRTTVAIEPILENLSQDDSDKPLYDRLGGIVRQLHDSLRELGYDRALEEAASEVIDAKGRLEYVATLTEQAATRVLNSIDVGLPQQDGLIKSAKDMDRRWALLFEGNLSIDEFKQLAQDAQKFSTTVIDSAEQEKARLMEIMMAQDFQDITGQIIKKVITITNRLEKDLAQLLRDNAPATTKEKNVDLMSGPDIPTRALVQDDVDSLLANLGF